MTNILVKNDTREIKHQDAHYVLLDKHIRVEKDGILQFYFSDLNKNNATVYQIDNPIVNFIGNKYLYENGEVALNPNWEEPSEWL
jgi:hypothetical protein